MNKKLIKLVGIAALALSTIGMAQSPEEIAQARKLRANAAYLEMKGETEKALAQYEESLQYLKDETLAKKVDELKVQLGKVRSVAATPGIQPADATFDPILAGAAFSRLDLNGFGLGYFNAESIIKPVRAEAMRITSNLLSEMEADSPEREALTKFTEQIDPFLNWLGLYGVRSLSWSAAPERSQVTRFKTFVGLDQQENKGALWKLIGQSSPLPTRDYLPAHTVVSLVSTLSISDLWNLAKEVMEIAGEPEAIAAREAAFAEMKENAGIDLEAWIAKFQGEILVGITLDPNARVSIPTPEGATIEIEQPSILLGFKVADASLFDSIQAVLTQQEMPITKRQIDGSEAISMPLPLPFPIPLEPTLMMHEGYLLLASNPQLLEQAVRDRNQRSGLVASQEYQEYLGQAPASLSGLLFVSNRLYRSLESAVSTMVAQNRESEHPDPNLENLLVSIQGLTETVIGSYQVADAEGILNVMSVRSSEDNAILAQIKQPMELIFQAGIESARQARLNAGKFECWSNLSQLEWARYEWSEANNNPDHAPTPEDLTPHLENGFPICPDGGEYQLKPTGESITCTVHHD